MSKKHKLPSWIFWPVALIFSITFAAVVGLGGYKLLANKEEPPEAKYGVAP